tara:strand:+ start:19072 stop:21009 length:1938 start_codon:yes stop_codon:yes gene_type:complete
MLSKIKNLIVFLVIVLFATQLYSKDFPVIVIAPSKKPQSISTVGTSVVVLDEKFLENTNEFFLGDVLAGNSTSINFFQNGGYGATSAIQLRGLPKRYSTVYIDGIKMSDPSSVSGDFDFNHILTSQISRVEILKGNQSSVYGSGAIGGTINITTKKGKPGLQKNISYITGSHGTNNLYASYSGADENNNFYIGFERFQTDGISQMMHNEEKDRYRNNTLVLNYAHEFSDNLKFEGNSRVADTYLQYDKEVDTATATHNEEEDGIQSSSNLSLVYKPNEKFTNKFTVGKTYIKRIYGAAPGSGNTIKDNYYGDRHNFNYSGNYNFNLDNSIVFGYEREDDQIGYNKDLTGMSNKAFYTTSSYFDFQSRLSNNIYATLGSRFDENSIAQNEDSHRLSLAYLFDDKLTKLKSSFGTGFRFPSLFELYYVYAANGKSLPNVKAENSKSFDFGIEKSFAGLGLNLEATYFNIEYEDVLEGWKDGTSSGLAYTTQNMPGKVKSKGLELFSNWKANDFLNFGLNYTFTSTYDGAEADDPNRNQSYTNNQMVRVPRNIINLDTNVKIPGYENLDLTLKTKWSDMARDYGNGNRTYSDERIDDYLVSDLLIKYNLQNSYDLFLNITNILDEKYETTRDYSQMDRALNFGIKSSY